MLVTAQQGLNDPRYPSLIGIRKANKKPLAHLTLADLGLRKADIASKTTVVETFPPKAKEAGKVLSGELSDQVLELVNALRSVDKVIG